ncbi:MAG: replicative DNA helicase [Caldisericia bacterium]|nr:replicative DNA helicase [Caldisericia bacterium]
MNLPPPHSLEAEQAIIGALLIDRDALRRIEGTIRKTDFYDPANSLIFGVIEELSAKNIPVDIVTLPDELKNRNILDKAGGMDYILQLATNTSSTANIEYYSTILLDRSLQRQIMRSANDILSLDFSSTVPAEEILDQAEQMILSISENIKPMNFYHIKDIIPDVMNKLDETYKKESHITGAKTGFYDLDNMLNGFQPSDLLILAARPSIGKTSLALNIATNIAKDSNMPVAIFSLEMSKEQLTERIICSIAEINLQTFRTGNFKKDQEDITFNKLTNSFSTIYNLPIYIDDTPDISIMEVRSKSRRLQADKGQFVLIVDYLQLMHSQERVENRVQEISKITRQMKHLARELKIPVLLLSQLSREIEKRQDKKPILSDLRESGSIEQDADVVMFLHRENKEGGNENDTELMVAKQRNGPTGSISLYFEKQFTKFRSVLQGKDYQVDN